MKATDLLVLLDREAQRLADENDHSAAVLMREAASHIRRFNDTRPVPLGGGAIAGQVLAPPPLPQGSPPPPPPHK